MTNQEAIEILQEEHEYCLEPCYVLNAIEKAISALRSEPTGEPLTLEKLREMDGKPVWIDTGNQYSDWGKVDFKRFRVWPFGQEDSWWDFGHYGEWKPYAYPPANLDREAWEPCEDETPSRGDKIRRMSDFEIARKMVEYEGTVKERTRYGGHKHTFFGPHGEECEDKYQAVALWYGWLMEPAEED